MECRALGRRDEHDQPHALARRGRKAGKGEGPRVRAEREARQHDRDGASRGGVTIWTIAGSVRAVARNDALRVRRLPLGGLLSEEVAQRVQHHDANAPRRRFAHQRLGNRPDAVVARPEHDEAACGASRLADADRQPVRVAVQPPQGDASQREARQRKRAADDDRPAAHGGVMVRGAIRCEARLNGSDLARASCAGERPCANGTSSGSPACRRRAGRSA